MVSHSATIWTVDPALTRAGALTGTPRSGWFPRERLSIEEAIQAYTLNTADAAFEDHIKGSLTVGKLADFVVLAENLLTLDPDRIKDVTVLRTFVGGAEVFTVSP
ncbi:MAG: amidohydrolase family protein [Pseudomonadota bacterium]